MEMSTVSVGGPRVKLNTGREIPLVGFGTYKVTGQEAVDIAVNAALECGYRHFDTAKLYVNEPELGNALEKFLPKHGLKREDVFLTTKFFPAKENNTEVVPQLVEESLKNLKTSYLDLVLIHYPKSSDREPEDPQNSVNRKDAWLALEKIPINRIHSIGVSNYEINHIEEIKNYGSKVPAVNQVEYTPHFRRQQLKSYCNEKGIFFQVTL
uniref:NADP-dependent oxidoreductase domain-containing protein n=1 Tax=Ditylenchus dipsaci TaxID=166011 RepID=A0A915EAY0_9BILA